LKRIILLILLINTSILYSQSLEIIKKADSIPQVKYKGLTYINSKTDITDYYFTSKIKITSNDFNEILKILQKTSIDYSANAFKLIELNDTDTQMVVILDLFSVKSELINVNNQLNEINTIYFFGNDNKTQKFKINRKRIDLKPNEVLKYLIPKDTQIKINKGGITGESRYHKWVKDQPVIFYIFGSGSFTPTNSDGYSNLFFNINTGKIYEMDTNFAKLLMDLKK